MSNPGKIYQEIEADKLFIKQDIAYKYSEYDDPLENSIRKVSILTPILVYKESPDSFLVIDGIKRVKLAEKHNIRKIPAYVLDTESLWAAFVFGVEIEVLKNELSFVEKARLVKIFREYFKISEQQIKQKYLSLLKLPPREEVYSLLEEIVSWQEPVQYFLHKTSLPLKEYFLVRQIAGQDRLRMIEILNSLNTSYSNMKELIDLFIEIMRKKAVSFVELISDSDLSGIYKDNSIKKNKKVELLKRKLEQIRYPLLCSYREGMAQRVKNLKLPSNIKLDYPENLESEHLDIRIRVNSASEYNSTVEMLQNLKKEESVKDIFLFMDSQFE